jgi:hypothetical protein
VTRKILRKPYNTVAPVIALVMGARYDVRPVYELVTKMARGMSCQKLSSLIGFHFKNLQCLLIIVRSGPIFMKNLPKS